MDKTETRELVTSDIEIREDDVGNRTLIGFAVKWEKKSHVLGYYYKFREQFKKGAFADSLKNGDQRFLWSHDTSLLKIEVLERPMRGRIKGLYGDNVIWINKEIQSQIEKACILAEELGHHHMTVGNILDQSKITNVKQEKLARKWAYNKLVSLYSLIDCYEAGCKTRYEMAELLNVAEEFLDESLKYYREKYGTHIKVDDKHILYLDPLAVYKVLD